uniref:Uncharacterized protein AlNc14C53G4139 n=1 Tax=Albugo laibachii Nc14 TaxID=890382 RepID=F0WBU8_9STRA|nr:conserved hypothetical protein [Albugo laibachii Nc14]|eukprot:CCA18625.1 conserved hypothetical protein [Albugo laibachii Nc14]
MTGRQVRSNAAKQMTFIDRFWRYLHEQFWRWILGESELQRLARKCDVLDLSVQMARFRSCLALSEHLTAQCDQIFDLKTLKVDQVSEEIAVADGIDKNNIRLMQTLRGWLHRCDYVNSVYQKLLALRDEPYASHNKVHERMLEELWTNLKPQTRRAHGRITKEWSEIGFQGMDPMTDFRGMGVLSLVQLLYFTSKYPVEAQALLTESNHPTHWYPFSVTGINVTAFVIELVQERLVDIKIYQYADISDPSRDVMDNGLDAIHEFYCDVFTSFNKLWKESNPEDAMAFPSIFQALKGDIRKSLQKRAFLYY